MSTTQRIAVRAAALALAAAIGAVNAADAECDKNHYILRESRIECGWVRVGDLNAARAGHTATLLRDGTVLVAGGLAPVAFPRPFDPMTGAWLPAIPSPDSAELYVPGTGSWLRAAPLGKNRSGHTATLLADGRVLVVGGETSMHTALYRNGTAEIFDPSTGTWTPTGDMITTYWPSGATATLLPGGNVLIVGDRVREQYDPQTGQWSADDASVIPPRRSHSATLLGNGKVLLVAGWTPWDEDLMSSTTNSAELYDAAARTSTPTASPRFSRAGHSATLLMNGKVLVSGGWELLLTPDGYAPVSIVGSSEIYDADAQQWTSAGDLQVNRVGHTATLLPNGAVLTAGGRNASEDAGTIALDSVELRLYSGVPSVSTSSLNQARFDHTATLLPDGFVLVIGGMAGDLKTRLNSAEVYRGLGIARAQ